MNLPWLLADDGLPQLAPHSAFLIMGLVLVFWLYARISIIRRQLERQGPDSPPPPRAFRWMVGLARLPWLFPVLFVLASGLGAALVLTWPAPT